MLPLRSANIPFLIIDFTFYSPTNIGITFNTVGISKYLEINYKIKVYIYILNIYTFNYIYYVINIYILDCHKEIHMYTFF